MYSNLLWRAYFSWFLQLGIFHIFHNKKTQKQQIPSVLIFSMSTKSVMYKKIANQIYIRFNIAVYFVKQTTHRLFSQLVCWESKQLNKSSKHLAKKSLSPNISHIWAGMVCQTLEGNNMQMDPRKYQVICFPHQNTHNIKILIINIKYPSDIEIPQSASNVIETGGFFVFYKKNDT